eukprot:gene303-1637_t
MSLMMVLAACAWHVDEVVPPPPVPVNAPVAAAALATRIGSVDLDHPDVDPNVLLSAGPSKKEKRANIAAPVNQLASVRMVDESSPLAAKLRWSKKLPRLLAAKAKAKLGARRGNRGKALAHVESN